MDDQVTLERRGGGLFVTVSSILSLRVRGNVVLILLIAP